MWIGSAGSVAMPRQMPHAVFGNAHLTRGFASTLWHRRPSASRTPLLRIKCQELAPTAILRSTLPFHDISARKLTPKTERHLQQRKASWKSSTIMEAMGLWEVSIAIGRIVKRGYRWDEMWTIKLPAAA